jgi:hypothetical protein
MTKQQKFQYLLKYVADKKRLLPNSNNSKLFLNNEFFLNYKNEEKKTNNTI